MTGECCPSCGGPDHPDRIADMCLACNPDAVKGWGMGSDSREPINVVAGDHFWQASDDAQSLTLTDKLIGLEVCNQRFDGATQTRCLVVPPEQVPNLVRALVRWCTTGAVSIAAGNDRKGLG